MKPTTDDAYAQAIAPPGVAVTVDVVIVTVVTHETRVLLIRRKYLPFHRRWALPGSFLQPDEDLEVAARRELEEETGVEAVALDQVGAFGGPQCDPRERVVTIAFTALVPPHQLHVQCADDAADAGWFALHDLPELAFDHRTIIDQVLPLSQAALAHSDLGLRLLAREFTLAEAQQVYEALLCCRLDKRNFRNKLRSTGQITSTGRVRHASSRPPAKLYRLRQERKAAVASGWEGAD
jgi:8-oxo-dGTP diphosphatase